MTLEEAILSVIDEGVLNPADIAEVIETRYDEKWLATELLASSRLIIAHMSRQLIGLHRRRGEGSAEEAKRDHHDPLTDLIWVPGIGYKRKADLSATECRLVAANYRRLADLMGAKAEPYETWAVMIEEAGVQTVSDLGAAALPEAA